MFSVRACLTTHAHSLTQLDLSTGRKQDIGSLDVTMNLAFVVQVLQSEQELSAYNGNLLLLEGTRLE